MIEHSTFLPGLANRSAARLNRNLEWLLMRTLSALTRFMLGPVRT
jgi:hypothetical protein